MAKQETKSRRFIKKLFSSYRMVIINEDTFEEKAQLRITRFSVFLTGFLGMSFLCTAIFMTISYTSLKEYIPGYDSSELRQKAIQNLFTTDSLITLYNQNIQYLNAVRAVISEDISFQEEDLSKAGLSNSSEQSTSFAPAIMEDSLLRAFVANEDKYNPNNNNSSLELKTLLFPPAKGPISQEFNEEESHFAVDIVLEENTPIKAIADGTVIFAEWTVETGFVIILEHASGFLSVYKHNASLSKSQGEAVIGGEVIASAGNTGEYSTGFHLHFELWMEGYPLNPANFFNFYDE
jgi:murein DD-endopeptidase MepM/ murein hydrolase activator NlpD